VLLSRPRVWLLDEPTASMDDNAEIATMRAIERHLATTDTLLLVTHKPRLLALVHRVVVLGPQGVVLDGPRDQVLHQLQHPSASEASSAATRRPSDAPTSQAPHAPQPMPEAS
jgi:ATP-binding cassette subfamily C protein LapB